MLYNSGGVTAPPAEQAKNWERKTNGDAQWMPGRASTHSRPYI